MARLKLRIRFNPGRTGAPLDRLGEFTSQTERFLRSLAADLGVESKKGFWLASQFSNESVGFDSEFAEAMRDAEAVKGVEALEVILGENTLAAIERGLVSYGTVAEFSRIGKALAPDDYFLMGVYHASEVDPPDLKKVTYKKTAELRQILEAPFNSSGSIQGVMHSWHQGADEPFFNVRELSTGNLIRCEYSTDMHAKIHIATKEKDMVVLVYGDMQWDRATNLIIALQVTDIEAIKPLRPAEFETMVGSAPNFTGAMTTAEYISWIRGDED
jgi:hypothetical protein